MPLGYCWRIVVSLCPFPDESADVYQIWCQSVQPFDSFLRLFNLWSPNPPNAPCGIGGDFDLAYAYSQMNPLTWTKVGDNRSSRLTASQDFWMFDPYPPPSAPPPCVSRSNLFGVYPFPGGSADVCKFGANRSSRLTVSQTFEFVTP